MPVHVKLINLHYSAQERTYMVGPHGGKWDTVKVDNFTGGCCSRAFCYPKLAFPLQPVSLLLVLVLADHIPDIFKFPDAELPIPYTELLITAVPGYKKVAKGMRHHCKNFPPRILPSWHSALEAFHTWHWEGLAGHYYKMLQNTTKKPVPPKEHLRH